MVNRLRFSQIRAHSLWHDFRALLGKQEIPITTPDDYHPSVEGEARARDIHALSRETMAAGVRIFGNASV
jgi:hypothetical protein